MKDLFLGYYTPTADDFNKLWQECVFAFDANMLLNIYRYTPKTQESFFLILEKLKGNIWIPHQAAAEFYKRRESVINGQIKSFEEITSKIDLSYENLKNQLLVYKKHTSVNIEQVFKSIEAGVKKAKKSLEVDKKNHPDLSIDDPLRDKIVDLFDGKVGNQFNEKKLDEIYSKAQQRFKVLKPPGYKDLKDKEFPDIYGDVVIWFQLMEYAKLEKKPLIFITDDRKDDWWQKEHGKTVSPRPELITEIWGVAKVQFYMYHSDQFIKFALEFLKIENQQSAVEEVQEIRKQDEAQEIIENNYAAADYFVKAGLASIAELNPRMKDSMTSLLRNITGNGALGINSRLVKSIAPMFEDNTFGINTAILNSLAPILRESSINSSASLARAIAPLMRERAFGINAGFGIAPSLKDSVFGINTAPIDTLLRGTSLGDNSPFASAAIDAYRENRESLRLQGLLGRRISRPINVDIIPKYSSDLPNDKELNEIQIEAQINNLLDTDSEIDEEFENSEPTDNSEPFEFDNFPLTVTLIHHKDSPNCYESLHKLRKPKIDEWFEWANNLERTIRYFSPEEIIEENAKKDGEDEDITEKADIFYSEMDANKYLYEKTILEIAGVTIDDDDNFPSNEFREIDPEIIKQHSLEFGEVVIKSLYECYCWKENPAVLKDHEISVKQRVYFQSESFVVNHILRSAAETESYNFRTQIISGRFSKDEENQETIELKLNLPLANDLYNNLIINVENATVHGQTFNEETKAVFLEEINPIYKFRVLTELLDINAWNFEIDDIIL